MHRHIDNIQNRTMIPRQLTIEAFLLRTRTIDIIPIPHVDHIPRRPPGIRDGGRKVPRTVDAPVAHGVDDGTAGGVEGFAHGIVAVEGEFGGSFLAFVEAIVVFEVVDLVLLVDNFSLQMRGKRRTPQLAHTSASFFSYPSDPV